MNFIQKLDHHAGLMHRMGDVVGADMGAALISGRLSGEKLRSAVLRCMACDDSARCSAWLETQERASSDMAPDYCRNRWLLADIDR